MYIAVYTHKLCGLMSVIGAPYAVFRDAIRPRNTENRSKQRYSKPSQTYSASHTAAFPPARRSARFASSAPQATVPNPLTVFVTEIQIKRTFCNPCFFDDLINCGHMHSFARKQFVCRIQNSVSFQQFVFFSRCQLLPPNSTVLK